jgi:hypothetical protein
LRDYFNKTLKAAVLPVFFTYSMTEIGESRESGFGEYRRILGGFHRRPVALVPLKSQNTEGRKDEGMAILSRAERS